MGRDAACSSTPHAGTFVTTKPIPNSAAARVAALLSQLPTPRTGQTSGPATEEWARLFGLPSGSTPVALRFQIAHHLRTVADEIDRIEQALRRVSPVPASTYAPVLEYLREGIDVSRMMHTYEPHVTQYLHGTGALKYLQDTLVYLLPDEGPVAPPPALDKFREMLAQLISDATLTADVAPELRTFVLQMVESLQRALRDYAIAGEAAIRREIERLLWEWGRFEKANPKAKMSPVMQRTAAVLAGAVALVVGSEKSLDAAAKIPAHLRDLKAQVPLMREVLGLPATQKKLAAPPEPKRIPAVASPGNGN